MPNITFSFAAGLNDSIFGKSQAPIRSFIEKRGEAFEQASLINIIFKNVNSKNWGEKFTSNTAMEGFQPVGENGKHPTDGMQEGYSKLIEPMVWKNRFSITREAVDDAKITDLKKKPQGFITSYYRTRELFAAAMLGAAVSDSASCAFRGQNFNTLCADGKKLFATDHPSILKKKAQSNKFSDAITIESLGAAETAMQNFKGDNGEILDISPDTIIIPNDYNMKQTVFEIVGSDKDPETSNNGFNYHYGRWNIVVHPYLNQFLADGVKPWILADSRAIENYDAAVWLERVSLEVKSRIDDDTDANVWDGYARFGAGFNDWRAFAIGGMTGGDKLVG